MGRNGLIPRSWWKWWTVTEIATFRLVIKNFFCLFVVFFFFRDLLPFFFFVLFCFLFVLFCFVSFFFSFFFFFFVFFWYFFSYFLSFLLFVCLFVCLIPPTTVFTSRRSCRTYSHFHSVLRKLRDYSHPLLHWLRRPRGAFPVLRWQVNSSFRRVHRRRS